MRGKFLLHCLLILFMGSEAQNEHKKWYFGRFTGLDFATVPPSVISHTTLNTFEGSASIADATGNLLFYTDGATIWNRLQLVMANGTGLFGSGTTVQSALIVKQPGNPNIYFVFTLAGQGGSDGLRYSIVDMNLAAGMGSVTTKNVLVASPCTEQLAGTRHCNGTDVWVVTHEFSTNNFLSFSVTAAGVSTAPVVSSIGSLPAPIGQGTIKISPNGKRLGLTSYNASPNYIHLFDFNTISGVVSNSLALLSPTENYYGCEFSPDGSKFYAGQTQGIAQTVYQWDLCVGSPTAVVASQTAVKTTSTGPLGQLQLAPDGKIYVVRYNTQALELIADPNISGLGCNYQNVGLSVATGTNGGGLPNFIGTFFKNPAPFSYVHSPLSCFTVSFTPPPQNGLVCSAVTSTVTGIQWDFNDPSTGPANISNLSNPVHVFSAAGSYLVRSVVSYSCQIDTLYQIVTVTDPSITIQSIPASAQVCAGGSFTLQATASGGLGSYTYSWTNGPATSTYVTSQNTPGNTVYTVTVAELNGCRKSAQIPVAFLPNPVITAHSLTLCQNTQGTLSASGGNSYTWMPGGFSGAAYSPTLSSAAIYTVTASLLNGCTSSSTVSIAFSKCTATGEKSAAQKLLIYPNPFREDLTFETPEDLQITFLDISGSPVFTTAVKTGKCTLPLTELPPGCYLVKCVGESINDASKVIRR